jgi:hypothetical protein
MLLVTKASDIRSFRRFPPSIHHLRCPRDFFREYACRETGSEPEKQPDCLLLILLRGHVQAGLHSIKRVLVSKKFLRGHVIFVSIFLDCLEEFDDACYVSFGTHGQECPCGSCCWVGIQVGFFCDEGKDIKIFLDAAFVVISSKYLRLQRSWREDRVGS